MVLERNKISLTISPSFFTFSLLCISFFAFLLVAVTSKNMFTNSRRVCTCTLNGRSKHFCSSARVAVFRNMIRPRAIGKLFETVFIRFPGSEADPVETDESYGELRNTILRRKKFSSEEKEIALPQLLLAALLTLLTIYERQP